MKILRQGKTSLLVLLLFQYCTVFSTVLVSTKYQNNQESVKSPPAVTFPKSKSLNHLKMLHVRVANNKVQIPQEKRGNIKMTVSSYHGDNLLLLNQDTIWILPPPNPPRNNKKYVCTVAGIMTSYSTPSSATGDGLTNIMENHTFVPRAHYLRLLRRRRRYEPQYYSVLRLCSEFRDSRSFLCLNIKKSIHG